MQVNPFPAADLEMFVRHDDVHKWLTAHYYFIIPQGRNGSAASLEKTCWSYNKLCVARMLHMCFSVVIIITLYTAL